MIPAPIRSQVRAAIERSWAAAIESGALPPLPSDAPRPTIDVERPANPEHGDLATNLAMKLARPYRKAPLEIATLLAAKLVRDASATDSPIEAAEVAPPGFVNLRIRPEALAGVIDAVITEADAWASVAPVGPRVVNVEFVSANPTGPLTIGNARGAFIGDLLSRVLEAGGQRVTREYYFNDSGGQIDNLGASVAALRRGESVPDDGYHGAYVQDLAAGVPDDVWAEATTEGADAAAVAGRWAAARLREGIEGSLERLGVRFDVWTSEGRLHDEGWVERAVERLREHGHVYEQDGALWFRSTAFGDDKDRVIYRADGRPTYFAADIGYVTEKFSRGFDHLIYIWGADHHGTVARLRNAAEAMGYDPDAVQVLLYAWVRFLRAWTPEDGEGDHVVEVGGRKLVMVTNSKRSGDFVTLDDLVAEVGVDAARWFFASRSATSAIDFEPERMRHIRELVAQRAGRDRDRDRDDQEKLEGIDLGVYNVQYAHARVASILRKGAEQGLTPASTVGGSLASGPERALASVIVRLPEVLEDAVLAEETHGITAYAMELASALHEFYRDARVLDPAAPEQTAIRLALVSAARITLARTLGLLGISAPESM